VTLWRIRTLSHRYDFEPVAVRIVDETDTHRLILIAYAAHLCMKGMGSLEIGRSKGNMELLIPQVIRFAVKRENRSVNQETTNTLSLS
jgi:hypothetical protein